MNSKILKNTFLIVTGILFSNINCQMFVSPNSSVFVNNEVVFIKNEWN